MMKVHILKVEMKFSQKKIYKVENHKNKRIEDEVAKCHSSLKTEVPSTYICSKIVVAV